MRRLERYSMIWGFALVLFSAAAARGAEVIQPRVIVQAPVTAVRLADSFEYVVTVEVPASVEIDYPMQPAAIGGCTVRSVQDSRQPGNGGGFILTRRFQLAAYEPGTVSLPPYAVRYRPFGQAMWQEAAGTAVSVSVRGALPEGEPPALRPLRPKVFFWRYNLFWGGVVVVALVAGLVAFRQWFKRRKTKQASLPPQPAHVIALEELAALRRAGLLEQRSFEEFYERLSACLRRYLENRFGLRAPWMSTEEFLAAAKTSPLLDDLQKELLKQFLLLSDLVKFARYGSSRKEAEDSYESARQFIEQTKLVSEATVA
ncbi:MAG: hypothetical protein NC924_00905 [Candidatus Omnitrophica bacterium]|nr:hypothetical protein [Candidatus Omnitrophota bacterium]